MTAIHLALAGRLSHVYYRFGATRHYSDSPTLRAFPLPHHHPIRGIPDRGRADRMCTQTRAPTRSRSRRLVDDVRSPVHRIHDPRPAPGMGGRPPVLSRPPGTPSVRGGFLPGPKATQPSVLQELVATFRISVRRALRGRDAMERQTRRCRRWQRRDRPERAARGPLLRSPEGPRRRKQNTPGSVGRVVLGLHRLLHHLQVPQPSRHGARSPSTPDPMAQER